MYAHTRESITQFNSSFAWEIKEELSLTTDTY